MERFLCLLEKPIYDQENGEYDIDVVLTAKGELMNEEEDIIGTDVVPIASLSGDDYVCLYYHKKNQSVAIWYGGESEEFHPVLRKIANSFSDFLNMINESWEY